MNYYFSILYRIIPLGMALVSFFAGYLVLKAGHNNDGYLSGPILISLGVICLALFSTAATIIRQIIKKYNKFYEVFLPLFGYVAALICCYFGYKFIHFYDYPYHFVTGHVILGVGFISICVSTVALSSVKFFLIPGNSASSGNQCPSGAYGKGVRNILILIPVICACVLWIIGFILLSDYKVPENFVAGFVSLGLGAICTSLIGLVVSIAKQVRNEYTNLDKKIWPSLVLIMGTFNVILGILILIMNKHSYAIAPGYVLIGLGMICYSISSKILLLAFVWKRESKLAGKVTLIPIFTALFCLILSSFLVIIYYPTNIMYIPDRILTGLGTICFSLFSIVSILESATSK